MTWNLLVANMAIRVDLAVRQSTRKRRGKMKQGIAIFLISGAVLLIFTIAQPA